MARSTATAIATYKGQEPGFGVDSAGGRKGRLAALALRRVRRIRKRARRTIAKLLRRGRTGDRLGRRRAAASAAEAGGGATGERQRALHHLRLVVVHRRGGAAPRRRRGITRRLVRVFRRSRGRSGRWNTRVFSPSAPAAQRARRRAGGGLSCAATRQREMACFSSPAFCRRLAGSFSSARSRINSSPSGASGASSESFGGVSKTMALTTCPRLRSRAENGWRPVAS